MARPGRLTSKTNGSATQQVDQRKQFTLTYAASQRKSDRLMRGPIYRAIELQLNGTVNDSDNFTLAKLASGEETKLAALIEVVANGNDKLFSATGEETRMLNFFENGIMPRGASFSTAATACTFASILQIPFVMPNSKNGFETALDSGVVSLLEVQTTFAAAPTDIVLNGAVKSTFTGTPSIDVCTVGGLIDRKAVEVPPFHVRRVSRRQFSTVPISTEYKIDLPTGGPVYRAIMLSAKDASGYDLADAISNVQLFAGGALRLDKSPKVIRDSYLSNHRIPVPTFQSTHSSLDAWTYCDLCPDGNMREAIDSAAYGDVHMKLNVTAAIATLNVLLVTIDPVRRKA